MKLYSFDFDKTLFETPEPELGKPLWKEKTGKEWPYKGWWSKHENLDIDIFDIPANDWVIDKYIDAKKENDKHIILATGRLKWVKGMRGAIDKILDKNNLEFDGVYLNNKGDTYNFKTNLFEKLIKETKCEEFIMLDDRLEHLIKFEKWAETINCPVTIIDVINKKSKTI
jgi:hypothetical protein